MLEDRLGTLTHATSLPVTASKLSISWLYCTVPSALPKAISQPSSRARAARSASEARSTSTGKSLRFASTRVWSIVIDLRYSQSQKGSGVAVAVGVLLGVGEGVFVGVLDGVGVFVGVAVGVAVAVAVLVGVGNAAVITSAIS